MMRIHIILSTLLALHIPGIVNAEPPTTSTTTTTVVTTSDSQTMSDADGKIVAAVYDNYEKSSALIGTELTVVSLNGNVTITGSVTTQSQEDEAIKVAESTAGVKTVTSNITVTTRPPTTQPVPNRKY